VADIEQSFTNTLEIRVENVSPVEYSLHIFAIFVTFDTYCQRFLSIEDINLK
jgi:hypothetical protein